MGTVGTRQGNVFVFLDKTIYYQKWTTLHITSGVSSEGYSVKSFLDNGDISAL